MDGIPYYTAQAMDSDTVPGLKLPHGTTGQASFSWERVCHAVCEGLACAKRSSHMGWSDIAPDNPLAIQQDLCAWSNFHNEVLRCLQAANTLAALTTVGVADYGTGNGLSINNLPVSVNFGPFTLVGAGGDTLRCQFTTANDPRTMGFANFINNWANYQEGDPTSPGYYEEISLVTMLHMGVANLGNSTWSGRGGFICYALDIEEIDGTGHGYFTLQSATPIGDNSRLLNPNDTGQPVQLWFRSYYGASEPIQQRVRDAYPLFCMQQTWVQSNPSATTYTCWERPHAPIYTAAKVLIEKQVGGTWVVFSESAGRLKNVPSGSDYNSVLDLSGLDLSGISSVRVSAWVRDDSVPGNVNGLNICQRCCANAREDYTQSIGQQETWTSSSDIHNVYCARWPSLNAGEKTAFGGSHCLNGNCRFFTLEGGAPTNHLDAMNDVVLASPFKFQRMQVFDPDSGQFFRIGCDSILSNTGVALSAAGGIYLNAAYDYVCGGWEKRSFYSDPSTGNQRVALVGGFEPGSASAQKTNLDNADSTTTNDPDGAFTRLTRGRAGVHVFSHAISGALGSCLRFRQTTVFFPEIPGTQIFPDGKVTIGAWDANGEPQIGGTPHFQTKIEIQHGIQMRKKTNIRLSNVLKSAVLQAKTAITGGWRLHLQHPGTPLAIPSSGGDVDDVVSRFFGGSIALPPDASRLTNWGCPDSIVGGSSAYAAAGCALSFDHPSLTAFQKSLRFKIIRAKSCDSVQGANWNGAAFGGVAGLPADFATRCANCDSVDFLDEQGQAAQIFSDLASASPTVKIYPGYYVSEALGTSLFWTAAPTAANTPLTPWSLSASGIFFFEPSLIGLCLIGQIWQVVETSVPSVSGDMAPIQQAIDNYLAGV